MPLAFWVCAGVTIVSSLVSAAYAVAGARTADGPAKTPSEYALARSMALVVVSVVAVFTSSIAFAAAAALAMILVQALDAIVGARTKDRLKIVGPAFTALANTAALVWMLAA